MSTKAKQILDPQSDWNQAPNDEPIFVIRANNWKAAMLVAVMAKTNQPGNETADDLFETALQMKDYHEDNDIPF